MEKINIAKLLKDCPKGMELDCTVYNDVTFLRIDEVQNRCYFKAGPADTFWTTCGGRINGSPFGKCVILPKGKTTWEGFVPPCKFKDGDIVATEHGIFIGIVKVKNNMQVNAYCSINSSGCFEINSTYGFERLATEEEKQKLFDVIKANGYKWNPGTKTLEKLTEPKFKVGDRVRHKTTNKDDVYEISKVYDDSYGLVGFTWMLYMKYQDQYELVPNKFDITTLKPFESRVLVRDGYREKWKPNFFGFYDNAHAMNYPFECCGTSYSQCIPYEGNEHLLGKTDDCDEYYKIWR